MVWNSMGSKGVGPQCFALAFSDAGQREKKGVKLKGCHLANIEKKSPSLYYTHTRKKLRILKLIFKLECIISRNDIEF